MDCPTGNAIRPDVIVVPKRLAGEGALAVRGAAVLRVGSRAELLYGTAQAGDGGLLLGGRSGGDGGRAALGSGGVQTDVGDPGFVFRYGTRGVELPEGDLSEGVSTVSVYAGSRLCRTWNRDRNAPASRK